jgi:Tol biopolymer transport system component
MILDLDGNVLHSATTGESIRDVNWSPDGRSLAYAAGASEAEDVYTVAVEEGEPVNLTRGRHSFVNYPSWSPDGTKIAFSLGEIILMNVDGTGSWRLTETTGEGAFREGSFWPAWTR